jgi:hypothetical protein
MALVVPDFSGLSINDGFDPGVTHCAIAMIEPSIHVELFEIWIIEEAGDTRDGRLDGRKVPVGPPPT